MSDVISAQPLEFKDFSGGITENVLQADPRRYQKADNWFITIDKKLQVRPGLVIYDSTNYRLPSGNARVNGLYTVINEGTLLAQSGRNFYQIDSVTGVWSAILGPSGNPAVQAGDYYNQTNAAEFQHQIFLASDGGVLSPAQVQPSKIYRDSTNTWKAVTAGLPRAYAPATYSNGSLLAVCITNANAIRTSMIAHFSDVDPAGSAGVNNLHILQDKYSLSYLQAVTLTGSEPEKPSPTPTPAPAATDQASLFTLVGALCLAFRHHTLDTILGTSGTGINTSTSLNYHMQMLCDASVTAGGGPSAFYRGPLGALNVTGTPSDLTVAAGQLDDLLQKWNWHRKAVWTHSPINDPGQFDKYAPVCSKIGTVSLTSTAPTITPDYTDLYSYVNNLKKLWNGHVNNYYAHVQTDNTTLSISTGITKNQVTCLSYFCRLPDCTDLDSMYLLIYWLRVLYGGSHVWDANVATHSKITATIASASANITSVVLVSSGAAYTLPVSSWLAVQAFIALIGNNQAISFYTPAKVLSSGSGTATLDRKATSSISAVAMQASAAAYHFSFDPTVGVGGSDTTTHAELSANFLSTSVTTQGVDVTGWLALATEFFNAFASHATQSSGLVADQSHGQPGSTATFPTLYASSTTLSNFFIPAISTVAYAFFFTHDFVVESNGLEYLVQGNPVFSASTEIGVSYPSGYTITTQNSAYYPDAIAPSTRTNVLSSLPSIVNDSGSNYDTSNIKLQIYRTTDGGQTFYLLDTVANGVTSYSDVTNDLLSQAGAAALSTKQIIYTSGGVVASDQPPMAKFCHNLNGTMYYGGVTDSGQYFGQRIRQCLQLAPDWCPETFFDDMDEDLTGLTSTRSNLIVLCKNSVYREQGGFNKLGQGALTHDKISDSIGCLNSKSVVRTEVGVFFAGNDGFYYTDGYQLIKISIDLDKTYAALTASDIQRSSIYGCYDKITRRVWWSLRQNATDTDNNISYVFYLDYGIKPSGTFTTCSSGVDWAPSSMVFQAGTMYLGDSRGYILKLDPYVKTDVIVDTTTTPTNWVTKAVPYNFTSAAFDMGTTFNRKYVTKIHLIGKNTGNAAITINAVRDLNQFGQGYNKALAPVNYTQNIWWGWPSSVWGDAKTVWKLDGKNDVDRRFPSEVSRFDFMQVQFVPATIAVYSSSVAFPAGSNAVVDAVAKTATIKTPTGYTSILWPSDIVNYTISFQTDNYVNAFTILSLDGTSKIITFSDSANLSVSAAGGVPWTIRGVKKNQRPNITSFVLHYILMGNQNEHYPGASSTSGPGNAGENPS